MNTKNAKLPIVIIAIGVILAVLSCLLTGILKEPIVKEHDFAYSVTYRLDGEEKTVEGVFKGSFDGYGGHDDPTARCYAGEYIQNGNASDSFSFAVAQKNGIKLYIVAELDAAYLMGDPDQYEYEHGLEAPYLEALDSQEMGVEVSDAFDAEIVSWRYPEPIENSFKFAGFSSLHVVSMLTMLLAGVLTIVACMIFVKRDKGIEYKALDKLSALFNFVIGLAAIPFMTVCIWLFPLTMDAEAFAYQVCLCIPAITAFTVALSIALRRKGIAKLGFFVQFVCPALFIVFVLVESFVA